MSGSQLGEVMYGLITVIHSQRIAQAILVDADLSGITCSHVSFKNANLRSANISAATFWEETDLSGADLSFANLRKLTVEDAIFQGAILISADLSESPEGAQIFEQRVLRRSVCVTHGSQVLICGMLN